MVTYERIVASNPWWSQGEQFALNDPDLRRRISITFKRAEPKFNPGSIYIVRGPKRIGKTFWIKSRIRDVLMRGEAQNRDVFYFAFEEDQSEREFSNAISWFLRELPHSGQLLIFLDEVQNIRNWQGAIKSFYDAGEFRNVSVIITGSIAHELEPDALAGRVAESNILSMSPLGFRKFIIGMLESCLSGSFPHAGLSMLINHQTTQSETDALLRDVRGAILDLSGSRDNWEPAVKSLVPYLPMLNGLLNFYIRTGGYPMVINGIIDQRANQISEIALNDMYAALYGSAKSDAAFLTTGRPRDPTKAAKVLDAVLQYVGTRVSSAKVARSVGMDPVTFANYAERLRNSFIFLTITGVNGALGPVRISKTYFADQAVHYAVGAARTSKDALRYMEDLLQSSSLGIIAEEMVANALAKVQRTAVMKTSENYLKFMELNAKREIDFVYLGAVPVGIEVKYQRSVGEGDLVKVSGLKEHMAVTKDLIKIAGNALFVPASIFLALLATSDTEM